MNGWPLSAAQRRVLERELHQIEDAALLRRVLAVLEVDEGQSVGEVAAHLHVSARSVYGWLERYAGSGSIDCLLHQPGQGRPAAWSEELERLLASVLAQRPGDFGYAATDWTVPLLLAAQGSQALAQKLGIELLWLPRRSPHLNPMDHFWRHGKEVICANHQYASIAAQSQAFIGYLQSLPPAECLRKAGVFSKAFWLRM